MALTLADSRRLTGPNLWLPGAGAVVEIALDGAEADAVTAAYRRHLDVLREAVGWPSDVLAARAHPGGLTLAFPADIDVLYAATEVADAAFAATVAALDGGRTPVLDDVVADLRNAIDAEADPRRLALRDAAAAHGVAFLWDDDEVSIGLGTGSSTWPVDALPDPDDVDWDARHDVPVVLVTGTNGKSTTVRMLATVLRAAGVSAGLTSTDGIHVGGEVVDRGDFSGPGGARTLLRHRGVEAAVLEVARGGMLRRGLPVERADAAIVTNIAEDHLGEYGIETLDDLAAAKLVVARALDERGLLVLNADDDHLVRHAPPGVRTGWTSQRPGAPTITAHLVAGGTAWVVDDGDVVEDGPDGRTRITSLADVPATLSGAARHNVANTLGVVALARSLAVPVAAIADGLAGFRGSASDNPGRANVFDVGGARVIVDFAHNVAGMTAIAETAARMPAERRLVMFGQAGDRSDASIRALAETVWRTGPDRVLAAEVPHYLRGREPGEVPALIVEHLRGLGAPADAVSVVASPPDGVREALAWARPGDLLLLMVLDERDEAVRLLRAAGAREA